MDPVCGERTSAGGNPARGEAGLLFREAGDVALSGGRGIPVAVDAVGETLLPRAVWISGGRAFGASGKP